jgi:NAD+ synthase
LSPHFESLKADVTEENIQARIRGNIIMACSNKFGWMPLSTGNKSEVAVGYCTLYGDMCGGFNPVKDLYKTEVFKLCNWRNANIPQGAKVQKTDVIPERIITRPPSAELAPDQVDTNSLPDYEVLDGILTCLVEHDLTIKETLKRGYDKETVKKVFGLLNRAEYKRRQSAPGVKLTSKALRGNDRRYPIVNKFNPFYYEIN